MKVHTTNYFNTFIAVAEDCKAESGMVPPVKSSGSTVANLQYDLLSKHPYQLTSDELLLRVQAIRNDWSASELVAAKTQIFSKGQACMRASPLTKTYGWGIHFNEDGKMALLGRETPAYNTFKKDTTIKQLLAMRSKKV